MWKHLFLLVLVAVTIPHALASSCYVSEIGESPRSGLLNKTHKVKNCNDQFTNTLLVPISLPEEGPISCFKITGTDPKGNRLELKGCIPVGYCEVLNNAVRNRTRLGESGGYLFEDTKCYECEGDNCNSTGRVDVRALGVVALVLVSMRA
ncbi:uncharacterized protein [Tenebrio molitor]|uniref:uncharacterized protein n=1 Tax=Tenebrio molitor TaxID=7067 RepID=UPI00362493C7